MCDVGGPRCSYSQEWLAAKRKLQRSKAYRDASYYEHERLERAARWRFQKEHPKEYQAHLPAREKWQTKAKPLTRRRAEALAKAFPKPAGWTAAEAPLRTKQLALEKALFKDSLPEKLEDVLVYYSQNGHADINGFLRRGERALDDGTREDLASVREHTLRRISELDEIFARAPKSKEPRVLYRHMLVEPGISPRAYAERYFKVGERVTDAAYMSTTEDASYIRGHAFKRSPSEYLVMQIVSRQGVSLQRQDYESAGSVQSWEKERLLPRGTKLRVLAIRSEEFSIDPAREEMRKQFGNLWYAPDIPPKRMTVVQLIDEEALKS